MRAFSGAAISRISITAKWRACGTRMSMAWSRSRAQSYRGCRRGASKRDAPRLHPRYDCARDRDQAIDIRVPHALHLAVIEIREIAAPENARIVHQNVDRA